MIAAIAFVFCFSDAFVAYAQNRGGVVSASSMVVTRTRIKKQRDIRWQNNVDIGVMGHRLDVMYSGGCRFGNLLYLGLSTGLQAYKNMVPSVVDDTKTFLQNAKETKTYYYPSRLAVPIMAQAKFYFIKKTVSPYLSVSPGLLYQSTIDFDTKYNGYTIDNEFITYGEISFGADFKLKNNKSVSLGLFFPVCDPDEMGGIGYQYVAGDAGCKLSYSF